MQNVQPFVSKNHDTNKKGKSLRLQRKPREQYRQSESPKILFLRENLSETNKLAWNAGELDSNPQAVIIFIIAMGLLVIMNSTAMKLNRRFVFSMLYSRSLCFSGFSLENSDGLWVTTSSFLLHLQYLNNLIFKCWIIDFQDILLRDLREYWWQIYFI